jgi:hypothetical protein
MWVAVMGSRHPPELLTGVADAVETAVATRATVTATADNGRTGRCLTYLMMRNPSAAPTRAATVRGVSGGECEFSMTSC